MSKDEIVDELLAHATEMVDDIALVMMDREFDSDPVTDTCEEHGVYYLNPKRKFSGENDTIEEMKRNDETVRIIEEPSEDPPAQKNLFLPSTRGTPEEEGTEDENAEDDRDERLNHRQEMREERGLTEADIDGDASPLGRLLGEIRGDEPLETEDANDDGTGFVVFQTNHPFVSARDEDDDPYDERKQIHMIARLIRWYRHRWASKMAIGKSRYAWFGRPRPALATDFSTSCSRASYTTRGGWSICRLQSRIPTPCFR